MSPLLYGPVYIPTATEAVNVLGAMGERVVASYRAAKSMGGDSEFLARDIANLERALRECRHVASGEVRGD